jgi:hypothetical protein
MSDDGWFKVKRGWRNNALFGDEPLSKAEAWLWLVENACHKAKLFDASGTIITVERGQLATSVRRLAEAWKWPKSTVDRFLTRLKTGTGDGPMIGTEVGTGQLVITICNYAKYQDGPQRSGTPIGTGSGTPDGTATGQQRDTNKEGNNSVPNGTGDEPPNPMDLKAMVFSSGRKILTDSGVDPKQAGGIIGRWRQKHSDAAVLDALARCQAEQPEVPLEWIAATLRRSGRQGSFFGSNGGSERPYHEIVAERHKLGASR